MKKRILSKAQIKRIYRLIDQGKADKVNWSEISDCYTLKTSFIREFAEYLDWIYITACHKHTKNFIREFKDDIEVRELKGNFHHIDLKFLEELEGKKILNEPYFIILKEKDLDEALEKYKGEITGEIWSELSWGRKLSVQFMEKWGDYLNWDRLSLGQRFKESFIEKHWDKLNKFHICQWQRLSDDFIKRHEKDFDKYGHYCWKALNENIFISQELKKGLVADKISFYFDKLDNRYWS